MSAIFLLIKSFCRPFSLAVCILTGFLVAEEEKPPLETLADIQQLLDEKGDELSLEERAHLSLIIELFQTPLNFWAKVVDTEGNPIQGANVRVTVADDPSLDWEVDNSSVYELVTDKLGRVSLTEKQGIGIDAEASAEGYAPAHDELGRDISQVSLIIERERERRLEGFPTKTAPAVLTLRKKGPTPGIQYYEDKRIKLSRDGTPIKVQIHGPEHLVSIRLWSDAPEHFERGLEYSWKAEIKPMKGKLKILESEEAFMAPIENYADLFVIEVRPGQEERWRSSSPSDKDEFWIKWEDGTYARSQIRIDASDESDVTIESWVNLDRNNSFEDFKEQEMEQRKKR